MAGDEQCDSSSSGTCRGCSVCIVGGGGTCLVCKMRWRGEGFWMQFVVPVFTFDRVPPTWTESRTEETDAHCSHSQGEICCWGSQRFSCSRYGEASSVQLEGGGFKVVCIMFTLCKVTNPLACRDVENQERLQCIQGPLTPASGSSCIY